MPEDNSKHDGWCLIDIKPERQTFIDFVPKQVDKPALVRNDKWRD